MVNLLQYQSTISHPTQMRVDGGDNFSAFGDNHLFCVLFVEPNCVNVAGGSTFSVAGMVMVTFMFPDSPTLQTLTPILYTHIDRTHTLPIGALKLYSGFCGDFHEDLFSCNSCDSQGHTFSFKTIREKNWLQKPSGHQEGSITIYRSSTTSFTNHHDHETLPQCSIHPHFLWTCLPSAYSPNGQTRDIHRTTKFYPQIIPPLPLLIYCQGITLAS